MTAISKELLFIEMPVTPAGLYHREGEKLRCDICKRRCRLGEGVTGFCGGYTSANGKLVDHTYGRVTTAQITQLGWAPVLASQWKPQTKVLSVGSRGCNFDCPHCVNANHALSKHDRMPMGVDQGLKPSTVVDYAKMMGCEGIGGNFNEALLAPRFWRETFRLAKREGLFTLALSNGYTTPEVMDYVFPYLDIFRVDVKAVHQPVLDAQHINGIKACEVQETIRYADKHAFRPHLELVTLMHPVVTRDEIGRIAAWIRYEVGAGTPWTISPYDEPSMSIEGDIPDYLREQDLVRGGRVVGQKVRFIGPRMELVVGDMDIDAVEPFVRREVAEAAAYARIFGLTRVFEKSDGH